MEKASKIYVAGHKGMVGAAITRALRSRGYENLVLRTHSQLDLTDQRSVDEFFEVEKPEYVFICAARVGGIEANRSYPAEFMYENAMIAMNVIHAAHVHSCRKLEFLGSSCIYPRLAPQPIRESALLTSELESTNEAYALAKISGLKYCEYLKNQYGDDFFSVMPCNLYGPGDNYDPDTSHVIPAMIRRFHEAKVRNLKETTCWGDGSPMREFLYVDDLAELCVKLMEEYSEGGIVNAGSGDELSIKELAELIAEVIGYDGAIYWDAGKPGGTPRKLMDSSKIKSLGWAPATTLREGLRLAYADFLENYSSLTNQGS